MYDSAIDAVKFIESKITVKPEVALILGSGLGCFADTLTDKVYIPFEDIPHFKKTSVVGHSGKLVVGTH